ncbi:HXXEE domain-containing protein [Georgenia sp. MJ170]|uniref:HXXEE domain-containing protein n=1 Tax=Georgenia sunbinii TaxID=3117728 RepID=UPI002F25F753
MEPVTVPETSPRTTATRPTTPTRPHQRRLAALWSAAVGALALHNTEEWLLDMTGWIADHPWLPGRSLHGDQAQYAVALIIITVAALVTAVVAVTARADWSAEVLVCVAYALMINAASHLVVSVASWSLMPGAISGTLVLLPLGLAIVRALPPVPWTVSAVVTTAIAALAIVVGSLALAAALVAIT